MSGVGGGDNKDKKVPFASAKVITSEIQEQQQNEEPLDFHPQFLSGSDTNTNGFEQEAVNKERKQRSTLCPIPELTPLNDKELQPLDNRRGLFGAPADKTNHSNKSLGPEAFQALLNVLSEESCEPPAKGSGPKSSRKKKI